ncbi:MAG: HEAT repeat domain-containing protein [Planctomycetaceae bacterium]
MTSLLVDWWRGRPLGLVRCALPAALAGVAALTSGCSTTSLAKNDSREFKIVQVSQQRRASLFGTLYNGYGQQNADSAAPHRRSSLMGSQPFLNNNWSFPKTSAASMPVSRSMPAPVIEQRSVGFTPERLTAVAKLFEAQGRTEEAKRIFAQIPQPLHETTETQLSAAPQNAPGNSGALPWDDKSGPALLSELKESSARKLEPSSTPGEGSSLFAPPNALTPSTPDLTADGDNGGSLNTSSSSSGWRVSPQALAKSGQNETVTVSSAAPLSMNESNSTWESSKPSGGSVTPSAGVSPDPKEAEFELPANVSRPGKWQQAVEITPGRFLEPTIRDSAPKTPEPQAASTPEAISPTKSDSAPKALPGNEAVPERLPLKPEAAVEEADSDGLQIIPNGSKLQNRIPATRPAKSSPKPLPAKKPEHSSPIALLTGSLREIHSPTVLALANQLGASEAKTRGDSAAQLGRLGTEARTVLPLLREILKREGDKPTRIKLAEAMVKIAPEDADAIEVLFQALRDSEDWRYRQHAAGALAATARGGSGLVIPKLTEALNDSHPRVRSMVALSLGAFGERAKEAVPRLEFAQANDIPRVKESATAALSCIAGKNTETAAGEPLSLPDAIESDLSLLPPRELADSSGAAFIGGDGADEASVEAAVGEETPGAIPELTE